MTATQSGPSTTASDGSSDSALVVDGLWKIFGPKADKVIGTS